MPGTNSMIGRLARISLGYTGLTPLAFALAVMTSACTQRLYFDHSF